MMFEVIIPHYSRVDLLRRALDALRTQTEAVRVCVVDNGSLDDSVRVVSADYPEVRLLTMGANVGFGRACNQAIRSSRADYVVLLNNDAVPEADFVAELHRAHEQAGRPAMLSPCLLQPSGRVDSYGVELDTSFNAFDLGRGDPYESLLSYGALQAFAPSGGAGVYSREHVLAVGGFDDRIFAYLEDVDLGIRLWLSGARWAGAPHARAIHAHSATLGSGSMKKNYLMARNKVYLIRKYRRMLGWRTVVRAISTEAIVSFGKVVADRNIGALHGWLVGWRVSVDPVAGPSGGLDDVMRPRGFRDGVRLRRHSRAAVDLGAPIARAAT